MGGFCNSGYCCISGGIVSGSNFFYCLFKLRINSNIDKIIFDNLIFGSKLEIFRSIILSNIGRNGIYINIFFKFDKSSLDLIIFFFEGIEIGSFGWFKNVDIVVLLIVENFMIGGEIFYY